MAVRRLVIATATPACSIALLGRGGAADAASAGAVEDVVIAERHELIGRGHAERLVPMIAALIAGAAPPDAILVDCGPGSFTGLRVGLAAARALGLAWGVPVHGCSSLALLAAAALAGDDAPEGCAAAIAGGHGELFVQRFAARPLRALGEVASLAPDAAAAQVHEHRVAGSGAAMLVAARGAGEALDTQPRAADARLLPPALATLPPRPRYGRAPDAAHGPRPGPVRIAR